MSTPDLGAIFLSLSEADLKEFVPLIGSRIQLRQLLQEAKVVRLLLVIQCTDEMSLALLCVDSPQWLHLACPPAQLQPWPTAQLHAFSHVQLHAHVTGWYL